MKTYTGACDRYSAYALLQLIVDNGNLGGMLNESRRKIIEFAKKTLTIGQNLETVGRSLAAPLEVAQAFRLTTSTPSAKGKADCRQWRPQRRRRKSSRHWREEWGRFDMPILGMRRFFPFAFVLLATSSQISPFHLVPYRALELSKLHAWQRSTSHHRC